MKKRTIAVEDKRSLGVKERRSSPETHGLVAIEGKQGMVVSSPAHVRLAQYQVHHEPVGL